MTDKTTADAIALIVKKQLQVSSNFKQPRMVEILENENINNFKLKPALQGRLNIPFDSVFMSGYIDAIVAETTKLPKVDFEDTTGANLKGARKITSAWERDSKKIRLRMKDRGIKKLGALSGRAIAKYYAENDPKYCPYLKIIDYLDFHCEPNGGGHLDDHYFQGEENIFRGKEEIEAGAESKWYDADQVKALIARYEAPDFKRNDDTFNNKQSRYATLGLDMESNNYIGGTLFNLVEWVTFYKGKKYHYIGEKYTGIWLRCVPLVEDFGNDLAPYISCAAPTEDAFNFWNLGPADKAKPIFEAIRLNLNEILNNNRKRNWDMKAVDKTMFPDIRKLDWKQDGVVSANVPLGQSIQNGIYRFETPEISGALNLNQYLNNLSGEKLGVNSATLGNASTDTLGVYKGNQAQISKRMRVFTESYEDMYEDLGKRYDWGLWDHASEDEMVKVIGTDGVGWEKITKEDKDPEYEVSVVTSMDEMIEDAQEKKNKLDILISIENDPAQKALINLKAHLEEKYRIAGYNEEKIKKLMNTKADATDELISECKKAIEQILEGKDPGINYSATTGYLQFLSDWILDNSDDLDEDKKAKLQAYFDKHYPIAIENAAKKAFNESLTATPTSTATATGTPLPENKTLPTNVANPNANIVG